MHRQQGHDGHYFVELQFLEQRLGCYRKICFSNAKCSSVLLSIELTSNTEASQVISAANALNGMNIMNIVNVLDIMKVA